MLIPNLTLCSFMLRIYNVRFIILTEYPYIPFSNWKWELKTLFIDTYYFISLCLNDQFTFLCLFLIGCWFLGFFFPWHFYCWKLWYFLCSFVLLLLTVWLIFDAIYHKLLHCGLASLNSLFAISLSLMPLKQSQGTLSLNA